MLYIELKLQDLTECTSVNVENTKSHHDLDLHPTMPSVELVRAVFSSGPSF